MAATAFKTAQVPRESRVPCNIDTVIVDECGRELSAWLGNISENGFMAECEEKFPLGATIQIDLPERGRVKAQVRWGLGWRFGALITGN